jgi:hypothetical protein
MKLLSNKFRESPPGPDKEKLLNLVEGAAIFDITGAIPAIAQVFSEKVLVGDLCCSLPFERCLFEWWTGKRLVGALAVAGPGVIWIPTMMQWNPKSNHLQCVETKATLVLNERKGIHEIGCASEIDTAPGGSFAYICDTLGAALTLVNAKGTTIEVNTPPENLNRRRVKDGKPPLVSYHTVKIDPDRIVKRREGESAGGGPPKALHMVRGHRANYAEGKGLFGKVKKEIWFPPQLRGSIEAGQVVKHYEVKGTTKKPAGEK